MPSERTKNPGEPLEESAGLSVSQIVGVLDHLEDCLMVVDTAGILRYWNESSSERFGTPDVPALGRPFTQSADTYLDLGLSGASHLGRHQHL